MSRGKLMAKFVEIEANIETLQSDKMDKVLA